MKASNNPGLAYDALTRGIFIYPYSSASSGNGLRAFLYFGCPRAKLESLAMLHRLSANIIGSWFFWWKKRNNEVKSEEYS